MGPVIPFPTPGTIVPFRGKVAGLGLELRRRRTASILPHFSGMGEQVRTSSDVGLDDDDRKDVFDVVDVGCGD